MQDFVFAARVLAVSLALILLPGSFGHPDATHAELCAAQSPECVVEIASYCDLSDDWIVDHYRKDGP